MLRYGFSGEKDESLIPPGLYCYKWVSDDPDDGRINLCPYWDKDDDRPYQQNGYCHFLGRGDWGPDGTLLLWDQCKECGINMDEPYDDEDEDDGPEPDDEAAPQ